MSITGDLKIKHVKSESVEISNHILFLTLRRTLPCRVAPQLRIFCLKRMGLSEHVFVHVPFKIGRAHV